MSQEAIDDSNNAYILLHGISLLPVDCILSALTP